LTKKTQAIVNAIKIDVFFFVIPTTYQREANLTDIWNIVHHYFGCFFKDPHAKSSESLGIF